MPIRFFDEDISSNIKHKNNHKLWLRSCIEKEGAEVGNINYIFCSDEFLYSMNKQYLNHSTLTDIITFDLSEYENVLSADIFISIERVRDNALKFEADFNEELRRVLIHGALHLLGYKDKTKADALIMREKENTYIKKYKKHVK